MDAAVKILMVSSYPPSRDGIAAYGAQQVRALRAAGEDVEVLSPGPSAAHHHLNLLGPRGALALAKRVHKYDKVIVQFHPDYFYPLPCTYAQRIATSLALFAAFRRARSVEVVVHEIDYRHGKGLIGVANRRLWRSVEQIKVHTEQQRDEFSAAFGVRPGRIAVAEHGASFVRRTAHTKESARASLGVEPDVFLFLTIGFIQPHKGFDRAVRAFQGLAARSARLDLVGSLRVEEPEFVGYLAELRALTDAVEGAHLHAGYVSDELFDRWIVAADVVVLPYRSIWSSGVLERVALYHKPAIATAVGGLPEQATALADVTLVASDDELRQAMSAVVGGLPRKPWPEEGARLRERVQAEIRLRAAAERGSTLGADSHLDPAAAERLVAEVGAASAPLRRLPSTELGLARSARPGASLLKRAVRRLTAWEVAPVADRVNELRSATVQAVEYLAAENARAAENAHGAENAGANAGEQAKPQARTR